MIVGLPRRGVEIHVNIDRAKVEYWFHVTRDGLSLPFSLLGFHLVLRV